ncbi:MAG: hypothetical protein ACK5YU_03455, partial [Burkholderiales bacterium]
SRVQLDATTTSKNARNEFQTNLFFIESSLSSLTTASSTVAAIEPAIWDLTPIIDAATKYGKPFQPYPFPRTTTRVAPGGNPILFNTADSDIRLPPSRERGNSAYLIAG